MKPDHVDKLQAYRVGGYVRDSMLGRVPKDCDWVVVGHSPEEMLALGFNQIGADFPVFLHPGTKDEYALARVERKIGPGYRGFDVIASSDIRLEDDLQRRDFTINAMALSPEGDLIDPFDGEKDLRAGVLRHVSSAFRDDPVRVIRAARFAARYDFRIAHETNLLLKEMVTNGEVDELTPERVWAELHTALSEMKPSRFIEVLHECGALERLFPELACLDGVPQVIEHHPEIDTLVHVLMALDIATELTPDPLTRFAVLVHDLGKGATPEAMLPKHHNHEVAGVPLVRSLCERYRAPSEFRQIGELVSELHLRAHRALELRPNTVLKTFEQLDGFRRQSRVETFIVACEADARGRLGLENREYPQAEYLRKAFEAARLVSAQDIVARGATGEAIGKLHREARIHAIKKFRANYLNN